MSKLYDPECELLARHFLGPETSQELVVDMARFIQSSVEDWFSTAEGLSVSLGKGASPKPGTLVEAKSWSLK